ncbi:MAG TPA: ferredoxin, partial [Streptosporangiaceae bacterium]|nr:ferredoxin [Streptosporangiaceae bacterium]
WIGLGAIAFDLMLVLIATSLLRRHVGRRTWRAVHWLAYACWPAAMAHSLGTGNGMRAGRLLDLAIACMATVAGAAAWRLADAIRAARDPAHRRRPAAASPALPAAGWPGDGSPVQSEPGALRLSVDPIACTGHGVCADLLPELIALDQWGYPLIAGRPVPAALAGRARRTVTDCPALALRLAPADAVAPAGNGIAPRQPAP